MSRVTVRIPTPLRSLTSGAAEVAVDGATVGDALRALERRHAGVLERILDGEGRVRGFVNVYLGDRNVRALGGLDASLDEGGVISIVPAVAGGAR
jgi:molybdopterin converting factor small subunit